jgi:hypothetical protein
VGKDIRSSGTAENRDRIGQEVDFQTLQKVIKRLIDWGYISLPKVSRQYHQAIIRSLLGDSAQLRQYCHTFGPHMDNLGKIKEGNMIVDKWKKAEIEHMYHVGHILFFWLNVADAALQERNNDARISSSPER